MELAIIRREASGTLHVDCNDRVCVCVCMFMCVLCCVVLCCVVLCCVVLCVCVCMCVFVFVCVCVCVCVCWLVCTHLIAYLFFITLKLLLKATDLTLTMNQKAY